ncbi:MAG: hypothetical protein ACYSYM_07055, partial [Planctomycetota bacterium]
MLEQTRREFLKAAGLAGISVSEVLAANSNGKEDKARRKKTISKIRVAQIKVYPDKGGMQANHAKLMEILADIEKEHEVDVLVTPEGFLEGYVVTEKWVTKDGMVRYAIDPQSS